MSMNLTMAQEYNDFTQHATRLLNDENEKLYNSPMPVQVEYDGKLSIDQERTCRRIWNATINFMQDSGLLTMSQIGDGRINSETGRGFESLDNTITLSGIGSEAILGMCEAAGIKLTSAALKKEAIDTISLAIARSKHFGNAALNVSNHYATADRTSKSHYIGMYFDGTATGMANATMTPSTEAFGANVDQLISDSRMSIAVALLRFHKSVLNRIAHRRPRATIKVEYQIPYAQFYSLEKSQDPNANIRNGREHKTIILDLYRNPVPVSQKLTPIVPRKDNAHNGEVVRDGVLAVNVHGNLMSLALNNNRPTHSHTDYTDLVSDAVTMNKVYITMTNGTVTESFAFDTGAERLLALSQNRDASERSGEWYKRMKLHKGVKTATGGESVLLSSLTEEDCIVLTINFTAKVTLKNGDVHAYGSMSMNSYAVDGGTSVLGAAALTGSAALKTAFEGYSLNAYFSEENLRKSNIMFRTDKFSRAYEIMCGTNYMIDYSMSQQLEEFSMSMITEGMSIGMDDRAISLFEENAKVTYARIMEEEVDNGYLTNHLQQINFDYVSGTRVNPWVYYDTIDLRKVESFRSSDFMSDVRQYVDTRLTRILSLNHMNTLYPQQLEPGEEVVYKVIASRIVIENLFMAPQIHNNIMQIEDSKEADGQTIEFARKLTSGVVLHFVSLPWDRMRDKILIMPFRPNFPDSELNYCHNWDYGTFMAHYTPQIERGVNKRIFMNARETPVITNPNIISLTINHFDEVIQITRGKQAA